MTQPALQTGGEEGMASGGDPLIVDTTAGGGRAGPTAIAFVGHSGSGKTTLLLQVIPALRAHGLTVAIVKHSSHRGIQTDVPGSDTRRLSEAGADRVALVTPDRMVLSRRLEVEPPLGEVLQMMAWENGDQGLILIEGYKRSSVPKIEVLRAACNPTPLTHLEHRLAYVTDVPGLVAECPVFGLDDVTGLVAFLLRYVRDGR